MEIETDEATKEEVSKVVNGDDVESSPTETPEDESSQEVKTEREVENEVEETTEKPEKVDEVEEEPEDKPVVEKSKPNQNKLEEQISNLNIALKQERDSKREDFEKIEKLQTELNEKNRLIEESKNKPEEERETYEGLTPQQVEEIFERKTEEQKRQDLTAKLASDTKKEIQTLSEEYNGKEGKPLYEDSEVFKWQKENQKLHLSPKEAFNIMKHNELVDYEVKQKLLGKKTTSKVEKPSADKEVHEPAKKEEGPVDDINLEKMVSEAINDVEREI